MSMSSHLLKRAIALWKSGEKTQARKMFGSILYNDRENERAWVWYIFTRETDREKIAALESFLNIFPGHRVGSKALARLRAEEVESAPRPAEVTAVLPKAAEIRQRPSLPLQAAPAAQRSRASFLPWLLVLLGLCLLLSSWITFSSRYNTLQSEYQALEADRHRISQNFQQLNIDYQSIQSQYRAIQSQYQTLQNEHQVTRNELQALQGVYGALQADHQSLQASYDTLTIDYNNSLQSYAQLRDIAIVPPYIYIQGREVRLAFLTPDQQTYYWTVPFNSLEEDLTRGNIERNRIVFETDYPRMMLNNSITGENYRVIDYRQFVDPGAFTAFSRYFYERAPSEEAFIYGIWYIVAQLTAYSGEITDTPRYPLETLLAGGGDCEDHAILFASLIMAAPVDWEVDLVYMDSYNPTAPQDMNHLIVYIDSGNRQYVIEATGKEVMEPYTEGVRGWYYEIAE